MDKIIIAADLGHFKAYGVTLDPMKVESPRIELIDSFDSIEAHLKLSEKMSDSSGRFQRDSVRVKLGRSDKGGVMAGYGEKHNMEFEKESRIIKLTADNINNLVRREGCQVWYLAASNKINNIILRHLDPSVKAKLKKNIKANLTNTYKSEILGHFEA